MGTIISCFRKTKPRKSGTCIVGCPSALENDLILLALFSVLDLRDLKMSRLVCQQWLLNTEVQFRKRTRISFPLEYSTEEQSVLPGNISLGKRTPVNINDYFLSCNRGVPLDALGFRFGYVPWTEAELADFFQQEGRSISDMKLHRVLLLDENRQKINCCAVLNLFGVNLLRNMKRLHIEGGHCRSNFIIMLSLLENIEELSLYFCGILLDLGDSNTKIRPKTLDLTSNLFACNANEIKAVEHVLLNDYIKFDQTQSLTFCSPKNVGYGYPPTKVSIKLDNSLKVKSVYLSGVTILEWENSNWTIDDMTLLNQDLIG